MRLPSLLCRIVISATTLIVGLGWAPESLLAAPPKKIEKKVITHDVYDSWRSIKDTALSRNGDWLVYTLALQDGDGEVVARNLKTGREWRHPRGASPSLTADGRFVAFAITPLKADLDKAKKDKKKPEEMPKAGLGVMDLISGKVETLERVKSFRFAKEGGRYLAALRDKPEEKKAETKGEVGSDEADQRARGTAASGDKDSKKKEPGTDLVLWELTTGRRVTIPDVAEYLWNRDGAWLAYTISVKEATKGKDKAKEEDKATEKAPAPDPAKEGTYLWRAADESTAILIAGQGTYKGLATDEQGTRLAFLSNRDEAKADAPAFKLYGWRDGEAAAVELASEASAGMPKGWAPSEHGRPEFSKDGARLFFGTAPTPKAEPKDAPEPVKVDLWH